MQKKLKLLQILALVSVAINGIAASVVARVFLG